MDGLSLRLHGDASCYSLTVPHRVEHETVNDELMQLSF